jgi:hypothetical protein
VAVGEKGTRATMQRGEGGASLGKVLTGRCRSLGMLEAMNGRRHRESVTAGSTLNEAMAVTKEGRMF